MSAAMIGALIGLVVAVVDLFLLNALSRRVDLPETKQVLRITAISQFVLLPVIGWFAAPYFSGE